MTDDDRADRLRRRRGKSKQKAELAKPAKQDKQGETSETDETDKKGETDQFNLKDDFEPRYLYLPTDTNEAMEKTHKRLQYELDELLDYEVKKGRDTFRLIVEEGLEAVAEMEAEEVAEKVESKRSDKS